MPGAKTVSPDFQGVGARGNLRLTLLVNPELAPGRHLHDFFERPVPSRESDERG